MGTKRGAVDWMTLADQYREAQREGQLDAYRKRRWDQISEFRKWLGEDSLPSLTLEQAATLYRASGGGRVREFESNPAEEVRDSLDFLLYDNIRLEVRFDECAADEGAYKLAGAGKEFVSYLLCLREPGLLGIWNSNAEGMLRSLGIYPSGLKQGRLGTRYMDLLEGLQRVRGRLGLSDFREVDELAYTVNRLARLAKKQSQD